MMRLLDLSGRAAIVTGGNSCIGLGMAKGLAAAGDALVIAGRNALKNGTPRPLSRCKPSGHRCWRSRPTSHLPGWIDTDLTRQARTELPGLHERVRACTPAVRRGVPEDCPGSAVFLASRASDFVTGTAIPADPLA